MNQKADLDILFIARNYPPIIGGLEKNAEEFYVNVSKLAHVDLLANRKGKKHLTGFTLSTIWYLARHAKKYDVIHFNDTALAPILFVIRLFSKAKVTFTANGLDVVYPNPIYSFLMRNSLIRADKVFPVSKYTYDQCLARGVKPERLKIILNGITLEDQIHHSEEEVAAFLNKYSIDHEKRKILVSVGRLVERKGHAWFIQSVFPHLPDDYIYIIGGDGSDYQKVVGLIREGGLEKRVYALGRVSEAEKQIIYQIADTFIMPNITVKNDPEGFGIVLLEAGCYNVPVVATGIEGISSAVLDGITGILISEGDVQGFIDAITNMNLDRTKIRPAIEENFTWEKVAQNFLNAFQELAAH